MKKMVGMIDGCYLRDARKEHPCQGDGTPNAKMRKFSHMCDGKIMVGYPYMEFEPQAVSAGSRHCLRCAAQFFTER